MAAPASDEDHPARGQTQKGSRAKHEGNPPLKGQVLGRLQKGLGRSSWSGRGHQRAWSPSDRGGRVSRTQGSEPSMSCELKLFWELCRVAWDQRHTRPGSLRQPRALEGLPGPDPREDHTFQFALAGSSLPFRPALRAGLQPRGQEPPVEGVVRCICLA